MPIPNYYFDDEARGLPRQPVPVRFACIVADWSPQTIAGLASGAVTGFGGPLLDVHAFNSHTNKAGDVTPKSYATISKSLSGNLCDDLQRLPANHFVWSDDLADVFLIIINDLDGHEEARQCGIKLHWNPELGENTSVIDECPDLSSLVKDKAAQNELSTSAAEESLPTQPTRSITPVRTPERRDDWFIVISSCINAFEKEHKITPNEFELWQKLHNYKHTTLGVIGSISNSNGEHLTLIGAKNLDRQAFSKRYSRLYP